MYIKQKIGKLGEDLATKYIKQQGYEIIERNFECMQGEIDIIASDKKEIVFIEVKTRTNTKYGKPAEAVDKKKKKHLTKAVKYYIYTKHLEKRFIRIDVIEVYLYGNKYRVNHIKQII